MNFMHPRYQAQVCCFSFPHLPLSSCPMCVCLLLLLCGVHRSLLTPRVLQQARQPQWQPSCATRTAAQAPCWRKSRGEIRLRLEPRTPPGVRPWLGCCSTVELKFTQVQCRGTLTRVRLQQRQLQGCMGCYRPRAGRAAEAASIPDLQQIRDLGQG